MEGDHFRLTQNGRQWRVTLGLSKAQMTSEGTPACSSSGSGSPVPQDRKSSFCIQDSVSTGKNTLSTGIDENGIDKVF